MAEQGGPLTGASARVDVVLFGGTAATALEPELRQLRPTGLDRFPGGSAVGSAVGEWVAAAALAGRSVGFARVRTAARARSGALELLELHVPPHPARDHIGRRLIAAVLPLASGGLVWATLDRAHAEAVELLGRLGWAHAGAAPGSAGSVSMVCPPP